MNQPKRKHNPHPQRVERPKPRPRVFKGSNQAIKMFAFEAQEMGLSYGEIRGCRGKSRNRETGASQIQNRIPARPGSGAQEKEEAA